MLKLARIVSLSLVAALIAGCSGNTSTPPQEKSMRLSDVPAQKLQELAGKKIYFGHQSVGRNIVEGLQDLNRENPRLGLNIVSSKNPSTVTGAAFIESTVGKNGDPLSKTDEFARNVAGLGAQGGVALHKYCYVDIGPETDVDKLFDEYRARIKSIKEKNPGLIVLHSTLPLTVDENWAKLAVKKVLGKTTSRDLNAKRNRYNQRMLAEFAGEPIFDLAKVESTKEDGSRVFFTQGDQPVYTLLPEYSDDGEHLNAKGRRVAAEQLLVMLAGLPAAAPAPAPTPAAPVKGGGK